MKTNIFLHLPKAAGSTLSRIITNQYPKDAIYSIYSRHLDSSLDEFLALPQNKKDSVRMLMGHFAFGTHEAFTNGGLYFTMLRSPVDRVVSYYYYVASTPDHYLHHVLVNNNLSIDEFIEARLTPEIENEQTRILAGIEWHGKGKSFVPCPASALESAKEHLRDHFSCVGLTEYFDESLLIFRRKLKWGNVYYSRQNVTRDKPKHGAISELTRKKIEEANRYDTELYEYARQMFWKEVENYGPSFAFNLKLFKAGNYIYNNVALPMTHMTVRLRKRLRRN